MKIRWFFFLALSVFFHSFLYFIFHHSTTAGNTTLPGGRPGSGVSGSNSVSEVISVSLKSRDASLGIPHKISQKKVPSSSPSPSPSPRPTGNRGLGTGEGPGIGAGSGLGSGTDENRARILALVERARRAYPAMAKKNQISGRVLVRFAIDASGQPEGLQVKKSSGAEILDEEAMKMIRRAAPFPPAPPLEVWIAFELEP